MKTGQIFGSSGHETNPQFESLRIGLGNPDSPICEVGFVNHETKQIFLESGFVTTIRNESMDLLQIHGFVSYGSHKSWLQKDLFLRISYTIPASLILTYVDTKGTWHKHRWHKYCWEKNLTLNLIWPKSDLPINLDSRFEFVDL